MFSFLCDGRLIGFGAAMRPRETILPTLWPLTVVLSVSARWERGWNVRRGARGLGATAGERARDGKSAAGV